MSGWWENRTGGAVAAGAHGSGLPRSGAWSEASPVAEPSPRRPGATRHLGPADTVSVRRFGNRFHPFSSDPPPVINSVGKLVSYLT